MRNNKRSLLGVLLCLVMMLIGCSRTNVTVSENENVELFYTDVDEEVPVESKETSSVEDTDIDYAFYCCDGVFNMDLDEAAECAAVVGAKHNIPYHVLAQDGKYFDRDIAEQFKAPNVIIVDEGEEIELIHE